jgi:hypothetical protein
MTEEEVKKEIIKRVVVTRQHLTLAKAFILNLARTDKHDLRRLSDQYAKQRGYNKPKNEIALRPNVDEASLVEASEYFTSILSMGEATWALIHEGVLLHDGLLTEIDNYLGWTTAIAGSGQYGGWTFEEFSMKIPVAVTFAPSHRCNTEEVLTDPNLFLLEAGIEGADSEVIEALEDAINCFRKELYRASVVLLGKAMEGAWVEMGIALAHSVPSNAQFNKAKFMETMTDEASLVKKINEILKLYKNKDVVGDVAGRFGIRAGELESIVIWSEVLRDARNAIHFGVKPVFPNAYEKVAVLLLAAASNLSKLYHIKQIAAPVSGC